MLPINIFISYSHKDERYLHKLESHLSSLKRNNLVNTWFDHKIPAGKYLDIEINENLKKSNVFICLISSDFIKSDYCYNKEFSYVINNLNIHIIPIKVRPVDIENTPLSKLKILPKDAKPVSLWKNTDEAWVDVVEGIKAVINKLKSEKKESSGVLSSISETVTFSEKEIVIQTKSDAEFRLFYHDFYYNKAQIERKQRMDDISKDSGRGAFFFKILDINIESLLLPVLEKRIDIEVNIRSKYKVPIPKSRMEFLQKELLQKIKEEWPKIVSCTCEDAIAYWTSINGYFDYAVNELYDTKKRTQERHPEELCNIIENILLSHYSRLLLDFGY